MGSYLILPNLICGEDVVTTPQINVTDVLDEKEFNEEDQSENSNISEEESEVDKLQI